MALIWGLAFPLPTHLSLMLLGFLICGIWVLSSRYQSQTQLAAKTKACNLRNRKKKQELTVSQLIEREMNIAADLTCVSEHPMDWTQEYVYWSIDRSLERICQHLDNAKSSLTELNLSASEDMSSSSVSDIVDQEEVPCCCYCKKGKPSTDHSKSSGSSPLMRGELEGHMSQKVSTLRQQVMPLPVKKSWDIYNQTQEAQVTNVELTPKILHSDTHRIKITPLALRQVMDLMGITPEPQILKAKVTNMELTPKILRSDTHRIKITPFALRQVMDLMGITPEPQTLKVKVTNVERTPKILSSATDRIKITPFALRQVMDSVGIIPESQLEVIHSVGFSPQPPHQMMELKSTASRLTQVTDNMKVTPVALFHVTDSMGMIDKLNPHVIEPVGIAPKPQYQVMESVKMETLHNYQAAIRPGSMSLGSQHTVVEAMGMIPQPQHKNMGTLTTTFGSRNQATKHISITPSPIHQNEMEISSSALPKAIDDTKVAPVAQQAMDFMQIIPPRHPHITKPRALIQGSQPPAENLTPLSAQPDVPTSTVPVGTVESRSVPPQPPSKVLEPSGMILLPSSQSLHALKVTPLVQASPTGMITPLQVVELQVKESLQLPSGLQGQVGDSVGMMPPPQGTEYVSLTPGLSHQVMDPSEFTPWHQDLNYSEVSPRQSHNMTETMGLTSDTWPQVKDPIETPQSHHQIMESTRTIPAPPDQGTGPIGRSQRHQATEAEVVPVIPLLQETETSVPSAPESPFQDVKSGQLTVEPQQQDIMQSNKSESMEMSSPPLQDTLGTGTQVVKEETLEETETIRLTLSKVDDTQGTIVDQSVLDGFYPSVEPIELEIHDRKSAKVTPGHLGHGKPVEKITASKQEELMAGSHLEDVKSMDLRSKSELGKIQSLLSITGIQAGDKEREELEPKKQGESLVTFVPEMLFQDKPMEVLQGPHLQDVKPKELTSWPQTQDSKHVIIPCLKQQSLKPVNIAKTQKIQGVKFMHLVSTQQCQGSTPTDLTLEPGQDDQITVNSAEWRGGMLGQLNKQFESEDMLSMGSDQESKPADRKPIELVSKLQFKDTSSFESAPGPVVHNVKAQEVRYGLQVPSVKPCPLTPGSQVHQVKALEPMLEPPLQDVKTMALNTERQSASTKSVQWIPISEFQKEKCTGSNSRLQSPSARHTELKPSTQWRGVRSSDLTVRSKIEGEESVEFHLESLLEQIKTSPLALGLQKTKTFNLTSKPQPQGIKAVELNKEPQVQSVRPPSPGVKSTEQKSSIQLGGAKTSEMTLGPKSQRKTSVDFNLEPQVQSVKTPKLSPGPELQKGENITSTSEIQSQCVRSVPLHHGPQLENTKSVHWLPLSDCQVKKSTLNLRLPPQVVTAKELKPSVQLRDVKTSDELTTRPKSQGKQLSGSTREYQSHRSKTIAFKPELQFGNMKAFDPTLRSKINNTKLTFKPRFCLEDRSSPGLNPGIQPQEGKPLGSSPGTQPRAVTPLVFKQESQSSEVKYGALSQRPQSQNNIELKCGKSSELAIQTKPRGMKSENSSGPQWQCAKCSDLTPETESQNMKCTKLMGTKTQRVKLGCKPGPQWQGIKSNSFLRTKPPEMEMEDCESGPKLLDLKSARTIRGIKVHDIMSVDFGPGPHLQGMTSEVITGKRAHGMKSVEIKPSSKLQGKKHDFTLRKMFLDTKSVELDSGPLYKIRNILS